MNVVSEQQRLGAIAAAVLLITGTVYLSLNFSLAPLFIVGIPGAAAYLLWYRTSLKQPLEPAVVLPAFLATAAGFALHTVEEYGGITARRFGLDRSPRLVMLAQQRLDISRRQRPRSRSESRTRTVRRTSCWRLARTDERLVPVAFTAETPCRS